MLTVTKEFKFEAAHSLPHLPEGHKCQCVHGHSYRFRVDVEGELDENGFVMDYADIAAVVTPIVEELDHCYLNEKFEFYTTAENLAVWIYEQLIPFLKIKRVVLFETATTSAMYEG